jgi:DNA-binding GntR family transcriptional regulator
MPDSVVPATLTRSELANQVKERLLEAIVDGRCPPDSRIVETAVAKDLGTTQAPVREALRALEAMGVVEITPFRGARVRRLDVEELIEAAAVRSGLEELAARTAMARMTEAEAAAFEASAERLRVAAESGDRREVAAIDAVLHEQLVGLSGNRVLLRAWRSLEPASRTYLSLVEQHSDLRGTADLHAPMLDAVRARDADALVAAVRRHFTQVRAALERRRPGPAGSGAGELAPPGAGRTPRRQHS